MVDGRGEAGIRARVRLFRALQVTSAEPGRALAHCCTLREARSAFGQRMLRREWHKPIPPNPVLLIAGQGTIERRAPTTVLAPEILALPDRCMTLEQRLERLERAIAVINSAVYQTIVAGEHNDTEENSASIGRA